MVASVLVSGNVSSVTDSDEVFDSLVTLSMGRWIFASSVVDSVTGISRVSDALGRWIMAASVLVSGNDITGAKDIRIPTINVKKYMMRKTCLWLSFRDMRVSPISIFTKIFLIL